MPSTSKKQHNFMAAVANNPAFAKKAGVPRSVGQEFIKADKGRKFGKGGDVMKKLFKGKESYAEELKEAKAIKSGKITPQQYAGGEKMEDEMPMKKPKRMAEGGMTDYDEKARQYNAEAVRTTPTPKEVEEMKRQRQEQKMLETQKRKTTTPIIGRKSGGMVSSRGDGIARRGLTKGRFVK